MEHKLHYKDIVFDNPVYSEVDSRDEILNNLSVDFLGYKFKSMVIPANMHCSIDFTTAEMLDRNGCFYILHRFYDYHEIYDWLHRRKNSGGIRYNDRDVINSISVGVKKKDYDLVQKISDNNIFIDFITIDIAFGHSRLMKRMIEHIKICLPNTKIIAGNVCTSNAVIDLIKWGADSVKVGLSMGKACTTYNSTGVGSPMFSAVQDCKRAWTGIRVPPYKDGNHDEKDALEALKNKLSNNTPIIADGGIRERADVSKALVAGATMVMIGSEFVKCEDSPAGTKILNKKNYKTYFGSASAKNKGHDKYVEGADEVLLPVNGMTYIEYISQVNQGVASCMSYHNMLDITLMPKIKYSIHSM